VPTHSGTATTNLQFSGQYTDPETGLIYLRARYYDPTTAQFLTIDPLIAVTGTPYAYVAGNPLNHTDPTGLCKSGDIMCWLAGIGKIASGVGEIVAGEEFGGAVFGAVSVASGASQLADDGESDAQTHTKASTEYTDDGSRVCTPDDPTGHAGVVSPRDVHGLNRSGRDIDASYVRAHGALYNQDDGQLVRVLENGNGTSDVVIWDPSNPSGGHTTEIRMTEGEVMRRIENETWW